MSTDPENVQNVDAVPSTPDVPTRSEWIDRYLARLRSAKSSRSAIEAKIWANDVHFVDPLCNPEVAAEAYLRGVSSVDFLRSRGH